MFLRRALVIGSISIWQLPKPSPKPENTKTQPHFQVGCAFAPKRTHLYRGGYEDFYCSRDVLCVLRGENEWCAEPSEVVREKLSASHDLNTLCKELEEAELDDFAIATLDNETRLQCVEWGEANIKIVRNGTLFSPEKETTQCKQGDIVIAATSGLWLNLEDRDIIDVVLHRRKKHEGAKLARRIAWDLVDQAKDGPIRADLTVLVGEVWTKPVPQPILWRKFW